MNYGSVADWVSGLGSMGAVGAAAWIAIIESNRSKRAEKYAQKRDATMMNAMIVQILRLLRDAKQSTADLQRFGKGSDHMHTAAQRKSWVRDMEKVREKAVRLQQFPNIALDAYTTLDDVIEITHNPAVSNEINIQTVLSVLGAILDDLQHLYDRTYELADLEAPFKW